MAVKLQFSFTDSEGKSTTQSFSNADPSVEASDVKALAAAIITNGSIYKAVPVAVKSAKLIQTTETEIDIEEE